MLVDAFDVQRIRQIRIGPAFDLRGLPTVQADDALGRLVLRSHEGKSLFGAELLRVAAERVKPGGTIVYSVCTLNPEENEAIVDASGLGIEPLGEEWPQVRHPRRPEFLLTQPHLHGTAGFFIARLRT